MFDLHYEPEYPLSVNLVDQIFKKHLILIPNRLLFEPSFVASWKWHDCINFGKIKLRSDENKIIYPDIKKAKKILNWKSKDNFNYKIKETINYYRGKQSLWK